MLLLGGSEGGLGGKLIAPILASRGIRTLALAYFGESGLPKELKNIRLEYFEKALRWLARQPGVDPRRVAILGRSRGAEAALLLGSTYPELVRAVIAYAPSSVVNPGYPNYRAPAWTLGGKPLPHVAPHEFNDPTPSNPAAVIPVERIAGRVLLVSGIEDGLWVSSAFADSIVKRRRAHGRPVTSLVFRAAGHAIVSVIPHLPTGVLGGTPAGDSRARARSWPVVLRLLRNL